MRQCKANQQFANISLGNTLCPGYLSLNGMLFCTCPGELQWSCTLLHLLFFRVCTCTSQYPRPQLSPPSFRMSRERWAVRDGFAAIWLSLVTCLGCLGDETDLGC